MQRECTLKHAPLRPPFSILGRIGGDATRGPPPGPARPVPLSVSSVGSEAMQREIIDRIMETIRTFSILGRIGGDATRGDRAGRGRETLCFQYPRSDRRRCNDGLRIGNSSGKLLSVSSVGSEAMQPREEITIEEIIKSFSILGRIGGDATRATEGPGAPPVPFQYPRSDRRRCNPQCSRGMASFSTAFSILGRIGGDATPFRRPGPGRPRPLSVSSVGSEAMQRIWCIH